MLLTSIEDSCCGHPVTTLVLDIQESHEQHLPTEPQATEPPVVRPSEETTNHFVGQSMPGHAHPRAPKNCLAAARAAARRLRSAGSVQRKLESTIRQKVKRLVRCGKRSQRPKWRSVQKTLKSVRHIGAQLMGLEKSSRKNRRRRHEEAEQTVGQAVAGVALFDAAETDDVAVNCGGPRRHPKQKHSKRNGKPRGPFKARRCKDKRAKLALWLASAAARRKGGRVKKGLCKLLATATLEHLGVKTRAKTPRRKRLQFLNAKSDSDSVQLEQEMTRLSLEQPLGQGH